MPIRLAAGGGLAYHGFPKLFTRFGYENIVHLLRESGAPMPKLVAWPLGCLEFFGGLALVTGYRSRPVAAAVLGLTAFNFLTLVRRRGLPEPLLLLTGPGRLALSPRLDAW